MTLDLFVKLLDLTEVTQNVTYGSLFVDLQSKYKKRVRNHSKRRVFPKGAEIRNGGRKEKEKRGKMHVLHFKTHSSILVDLLTIVFSHEKRGLG